MFYELFFFNCVTCKPKNKGSSFSKPRILTKKNEMRALDKLKSKLEINIVMEKRMLDTCQHIEYGL